MTRTAGAGEPPGGDQAAAVIGAAAGDRAGVVLSRPPGRPGGGAGPVCAGPGRAAGLAVTAGAEGRWPPRRRGRLRLRPLSCVGGRPRPLARGRGAAAPAGPGRSGARLRPGRGVPHRVPHRDAMAGCGACLAATRRRRGRRRPGARGGPVGHVGEGIVIVMRQWLGDVPDPHRAVQRDLHPRHDGLHRPVSHRGAAQGERTWDRTLAASQRERRFGPAHGPGGDYMADQRFAPVTTTSAPSLEQQVS